MKKKRKGYTMFRQIKMAGHVLILAGCFFCARWVMQQLWQERALPLTALYLISLEGTWILMEAGDVEKRRFLDLVYGQFFGVVAANLFFGALMCTVSSFSIWEILSEFFLLMLLEAAAGIFWTVFCFRLYLKGQSCKQALFVYGDREDVHETVQNNNRANGYFKIVSQVHFRDGTDKIETVLKNFDAVYLGDIPSPVRNRIIKQCIRLDMDCFSIPKISDIYIQNANILRLQDKVLFQYRKGGLSQEQMQIKRAEDLIVSVLLLILAAPLMAVIAALIYLEDRGPVLYRQIRYTKDSRPFMMLKFRSMHVDAEKDGPRLASRNDSRVTKVGKIIRNLHFDELPQLFNVVKGEMSMVGPRPERREFIREYSRIIPEFSERMKVKGGITGYAQIYGKYNTGPEDKIKYDLIYIYNYSIRLDIRLLFLTVRILFQKESSEGVEEGQRSAARERKEKRHGEDQTS